MRRESVRSKSLEICWGKEENTMTKNGGLLQLVATGKQDIFLTGNPQVSWFKQVYRRYTNFAVESKRMYFDGSPDFGQRISCLVPRAGDLLGPIFLEINLPAITFTDLSAAQYCNSIGHALIKEITIQIGEQEIDKQNGEFMQINYKLTIPNEKTEAYKYMIGEIGDYPAEGLNGPLRLQIPLQFWFNKSPGSYLPLLALQYHPVRINIQLRPLRELIYFPESLYNLTCNDALPITTSNFKIDSLSMWGDYVFLDVEERRRFVSTPLEYLITQVQYTPKESIIGSAASASIDIDFNHPLKEMMWVLQRSYTALRNEHFNYSNLGYSEEATNTTGGTVYRTSMYTDAVLQLDGQDRFDKRRFDYFSIIQPYQRHTSIPYYLYINNYCFALNPEDVQPSGSMNASRIDTIKLQLDMNNTVADYSAEVNGIRGETYLTVYAINQNVLRIVDGFGGVLFSV